MATIKELQELTGWSENELRKTLQSLIDKKLTLQFGDEFINVIDFIDLVNDDEDFLNKMAT